MIVVSLFDGPSTGLLSLKEAGARVDAYYASEVDKYAIQVSEANFGDGVIRVGDVQNWRSWELAFGIDWSKVDLIIGGSPCQGFSFAGKQLAFDDPRSKLFFEYVDILNHVKSVNPDVKFLLENVRMKQEYMDVITEHLGVQPIMINSALISAQNRKRYYWANWDFGQPEDKGIMLSDIVHENVDIPSSVATGDKSYALTASYGKASVKNRYAKGQRTMLFEELESYIVPFDRTLQIIDKEIARGKVGYYGSDSQSRRVYYIHDKAVTLCGEGGGGGAKMGQYLFGCITPDRVNKRQNGQRFSDGKKFYTLTAQDKHGILIEGYIRKLTPIECARLQTLPDNFCSCVSDSQAYKIYGNGWTKDIFVGMFEELLKWIN